MPKKFHMAILPFTLVLLGAAPSGERNGPAPSVETHCFPDVKVPFGRNVDAHGFPVSVGSKDATKEFVENLLDPTEQMVLRTSGNLSHDLSEQPYPAGSRNGLRRGRDHASRPIAVRRSGVGD